MFIPNRYCFLRRKAENADIYGQYLYDEPVRIKFALVRLDTKSEDSTVRADSSATRGNIKEFVSSGRILVKENVNPNWGDLVIINDKTYRIKEVEPRYHVLGHLDHYELDIEKYNELS